MQPLRSLHTRTARKHIPNTVATGVAHKQREKKEKKVAASHKLVVSFFPLIYLSERLCCIGGDISVGKGKAWVARDE